MSKLDESVTIHFEEDSIPSLRRGPLTKESKDAIKALFLDRIGHNEGSFTSQEVDRFKSAFRKWVQDL